MPGFPVDGHICRFSDDIGSLMTDDIGSLMI